MSSDQSAHVGGGSTRSRHSGHAAVEATASSGSSPGEPVGAGSRVPHQSQPETSSSATTASATWPGTRIDRTSWASTATPTVIPATVPSRRRTRDHVSAARSPDMGRPPSRTSAVCDAATARAAGTHHQVNGPGTQRTQTPSSSAHSTRWPADSGRAAPSAASGVNTSSHQVYWLPARIIATRKTTGARATTAHSSSWVVPYSSERPSRTSRTRRAGASGAVLIAGPSAGRARGGPARAGRGRGSAAPATRPPGCPRR